MQGLRADVARLALRVVGAWSADGLTLAAGGTERFDRDKAEMMGQAYFSTKIGRVVLYEATGKARIMKRRQKKDGGPACNARET